MLLVLYSFLATIIWTVVLIFAIYVGVLLVQFLKLGIAYYTRELEQAEKKSKK